MDSPAILWNSEMGLEDLLFEDECNFMNSIDEELAAIINQDTEKCLSPDGNNSSSSSTLIHTPSNNSIDSLCMEPNQVMNYIIESPSKHQKPNNFSNFSSLPNLDGSVNSSAPILLNFGTTENPNNPSSRALNPNEEAAFSQVLNNGTNQAVNNNLDDDQIAKVTQPVKKATRVRPQSQTYDHIIAERKRREQLSQRFLALSTIVPGLKKMDKISVLGDAINYLKHLQERVKILEEQAMKQTMESVMLVKKSKFKSDEDGSCDDGNVSSVDEQPLPEIEARVCNNNILIRIQCEKQRSVFINLLSKVEKLHMTVINTHVIPFGNFAIDITIIAEMEKEFRVSIKELVKKLRTVLRPSL